MPKLRNYTSVTEDKSYVDSLMSMYEKSIDTYFDTPFKTGSRVEGTVMSVNDNYAVLDIGYRQEVFINVEDESSHAKEILVEGNRIEVTIKEINTSNNRNVFAILGSVDMSIRHLVLEQLIESINDKDAAYEGVIEQLIDNAGYIVSISGIKAFMPGSLASMNLLSDNQSLVGKKLPVMVVNYMKEKNTLIVSHKEYLSRLIPSAIDALSKEEWYEGTITGQSDFGIFVEFNGCLTGLIYKTDIDEDTKSLYENKQLKPGTVIKFKIKDIISNKRIILTQTNAYDPWLESENKYKKGRTYTGKILKKKEFGTFVELEPGLMGLCGYIIDGDIGSSIQVKIDKVDKSKRKIHLLRVN